MYNSINKKNKQHENKNIRESFMCIIQTNKRIYYFVNRIKQIECVKTTKQKQAHREREGD